MTSAVGHHGGDAYVWFKPRLLWVSPPPTHTHTPNPKLPPLPPRVAPACPGTGTTRPHGATRGAVPGRLGNLLAGRSGGVGAVGWGGGGCVSRGVVVARLVLRHLGSRGPVLRLAALPPPGIARRPVGPSTLDALKEGEEAIGGGGHRRGRPTPSRPENRRGGGHGSGMSTALHVRR